MKKVKFLIVLMLACFSLTAVAQDAAEKPAKKEKVKVEKPFIVHDKSVKVIRVDIRKDSKGEENVIQIDATNAAGGTALATKSAPIAPAVITNVNIVNGSFNQTRELGKTARGMSMQLLDVVFPCRVRITLSDQFIDVEIKEPGFWKVAVSLAN